jgi:transcriptional regulator with XRE-family HTH domain
MVGSTKVSLSLLSSWAGVGSPGKMSPTSVLLSAIPLKTALALGSCQGDSHFRIYDCRIWMMSISKVKRNFEEPYTPDVKGVLYVPGRKNSSVTPVDEKTIGKRLRETRLRLDMTQAQLAEAVGIDQSLISDYERGEVRMHGALVAAFAKALKTSSDELLGLRPNTGNGRVNDRRFLRRLQYIESLSKRQKDALLTTIDNFLKASGVGPRHD